MTEARSGRPSPLRSANLTVIRPVRSRPERLRGFDVGAVLVLVEEEAVRLRAHGDLVDAVAVDVGRRGAQVAEVVGDRALLQFEVVAPVDPEAVEARVLDAGLLPGEEVGQLVAVRVQHHGTRPRPPGSSIPHFFASSTNV